MYQQQHAKVRQSEAIRLNQRQSDSIRGNQRTSSMPKSGFTERYEKATAMMR